MRVILIAAICMMVPGFAAAESASVPSGQKTQVTIHSRFDSHCRPAHVVITLLAAPKNGSMTTEPADDIVPAVNRNGVKQYAQCVGKTIRGVAVFYQSNPGFVGDDSFRYSRINADKADDRFNKEVTYTITVK